MADVNRGNRPLSPFMFGQVYRIQMGSAMSIFHRISGCALGLGGVLLVWWFMAAARGPAAFARADDLLTSWLGGLVLLVCLLALWYHFFTGIRHLVWDVGIGFELERVRISAYLVLAGALVMTLITLIVGWT